VHRQRRRVSNPSSRAVCNLIYALSDQIWGDVLDNVLCAQETVTDGYGAVMAPDKQDNEQSLGRICSTATHLVNLNRKAKRWH
jgi:hypothetical protein